LINVNECRYPEYISAKGRLEETTMHITNYSIAFGVATVVGFCFFAPVNAAPALTNTAAIKAAADNTITEVRYIRRGWARAAVATGVGLAVAGAAASYAYGYPYGYGYPSYGYGYPSSYGYAPYSSGSYGYTPYGYNYGYGTYGYNYGYTPGYHGYGVRPVARAVVRRAYYRRR
jgi:hypothetical protein